MASEGGELEAAPQNASNEDYEVLEDGDVLCHICNLRLNCYRQYVDHIGNKLHKKNLRRRDRQARASHAA